VCLNRLLSNRELATVLSFVDVRPVRSVCKYWQQLTYCEDVDGRDAPSVDYALGPLLPDAPPVIVRNESDPISVPIEDAEVVAALSSLSDEGSPKVAEVDVPGISVCP
jgi:hypothetical protein